MLRVLIALLCIGAASAAPASVDPATRDMLEELRRQDQRIATISYRLLTANVAMCRQRAHQTGLLIHDAGQYAREIRPSVIVHFALGDRLAVQTVVPGSVAARAGWRPGDNLVSINGQPLPSAPVPAKAKPSPRRLEQTLAAIEAALARGPAEMEVERAGQRLRLPLQGAAACASNVELMTSDEHNSWADGRNVAITTAMAGFTASDDELAALIAHELAHNIAAHPATLRAAGVPERGMLRALGKNAGRVRQTEIEADYLSVYLLANAGYEIDAAPAFWRRLGDEHGLPGLLADPTHPGTRQRVELLRAAVAEVRDKRIKGEPLTPR